MARWILNRPAEHCSEAEIKTANYLRKLSNRWTVRWGFYYNDNNGTRREGDFLILGPEGGVLVMEVKGQKIRHFAISGNWEGEMESNRDHPLFQLDQEWKSVINALDAHGGHRPRVSKALGMPNDFVHADQKSAEGIPRELIFAVNDLSNFHEGWKRCFKNPVRKVSQAERKTFMEVYGKGGRAEDTQAFIDHTEELFRNQFVQQYELLDMLEGNQQLLVEGGSGTGKTWHAVEKAVRLAESNGGRDVLLLSYNRALGHLLKDLVARRQLEAGKITVCNWEELAGCILESCGMENHPPDSGSGATNDEIRDYYERDLPGLMLECVRDPALASKLPKFDCLVVDEAQDHDTGFHADLGEIEEASCGWWSIYWNLLHEGTSAPMALFYDPAQRPPFRQHQTFDPSRLRERLSQSAHVRLPKILRYTRQIFEFLRSLEGTGTRELLSELEAPEFLPEGPEVELRTATSENGDIGAAVISILEEWQKAGYCSPDDVLLLHQRSTLDKSALGDHPELLSHPLVEYGSQNAGGVVGKAIRHTSIHKAKGLDSLAVIIVGLRPFETISTPDFQHTYFMGASRAKQMLGIVHSP